MKKIVLIVAAMVAGLSLSAQQKGDMYVSGTLNLGLNSNGTVLKGSVGNDSGRLSETTNQFNFGIAPKFGYFIADNLEVNVALKYNLDFTGNVGSQKINGTVNKDTPSSNSVNTLMVTPGVSYYLPVIADKFYYAPSFGIGLGFASPSETSGNNTTSGKANFAFGMYLDFLAFEYRMNSNMALTMSVGGLGYSMVTRSGKEDVGGGNTVKFTATGNVVDFGFDKVALGFKYYF